MRSSIEFVQVKCIKRTFLWFMSFVFFKRDKGALYIKFLFVAFLSILSANVWSQVVALNFLVGAPTITNIQNATEDATPEPLIPISFLPLGIPGVLILKPEYGSSIVIGFQVGDTETAPSNLQVSWIEELSTFESPLNYVISAVDGDSTGRLRELTISAAWGETGRASITLVVRDGDDFTATSGLEIIFGDSLWVTSSSVSSATSSSSSSSLSSSFSSVGSSTSASSSSAGSNSSVLLEYQYDALGRLVIVNKDGSLKTRYCYDSAGNRSKVLEAAGSCE